jgi:Xaa-Pro aminopeptidase
MTAGEGRVAEVVNKIERVRAWLETTDRGAVLVTTQPNFAWITAGGRSHISIGEAAGVASALVTRASAYMITTNIELQRLLDEEAEGLPFEGVSHPWHASDGTASVVAELCDPEKAVSDAASSGLREAGTTFAKLRYELTPREVARYGALGRDSAAAVEAACRACEPGDSELDIAALVAYECARRDILALVDLVAADDRIALYRHPLPTARRLEHTLLVALTGRRHGLHASLSRMVSFGAPDEDLATRFEAVTRVDAREIDASRPGARLSEVMVAGAEQYAAEGFPEEWRHHHQGGLTGYAGREIFATPETNHRLRENEAVAWNPSITRVKSEDTVLVAAEGQETLTRTGEWPEVEVAAGGSPVARPALLVR